MHLDPVQQGQRPYIPRQIVGLAWSDWLAACRSHRWLIAGWIIGFMIVVAVVYNSITPRYMASATLMLDTRTRHLGNFEVLSSLVTLPDPTPIVRSEQQVLESTALANQVIDELKLDKSQEFSPSPSIKDNIVAWIKQQIPSWVLSSLPATQVSAERERSNLIDRYLKRLTVTNGERGYGIKVSFWASDPELVAKIVNTHLRLYIQGQHTLKQKAADAAMLWLNRQVARLDTIVAAKERALGEFRESSGLVHAQGSTVLAKQVAQVTEALSNARADLAQRQAKITEAEQGLSQNSTVQSDVLNSPLIQRLRGQEADLSHSLVNLRMRYDDHSRQVELAKAVLADLRSSISRETTRIIDSMRSDAEITQQRVATLTNILSGLQEKLNEQDRLEQQLSEKERDVAAARSVYRDLLSRQQQVEALVGAENSDARVVSPALAPLQSVFPSKSIFGGVGLLLATISGVGIAFIGDRIKGRVDRLETIESLGRTLSLDAIPLVSRRAQRGRSLPDYMLDTPAGAFADAMRALRGDIMNAMPAGGAGANQSHVIAVSSALPGEGKTTVAVVMARSLAAIGARVLLIDCDLRRPQIAQLLKISSEKRAGIVQVLQGQASIEAMIADDPRSSLKVLSADQHVKAPQDLLGSESFKSIIGVARKQYDFVVIDTPPEGAVSDVHLVTPHVDSTLLVVRWRSTPLRAVVLAMAAFEKRRVVLDGILLNGVDFAEAARVSGRYNLYRAAKAYYAKLVQ